MPRADLVIFDCDGVLVDSEVLVVELEAELLAAVGVHLSPGEIAETFVGLSDAEMHRRIEERWGVVLDDAFSATKSARVATELGERLEAVPGIATLLAADAGPRCVASSSAPDRIAASLARTGLAPYFGPHVFSASMVERGKPAPDLFLHSAAAMGVAADRCVVVEDSPHGVAAGVAAGMPVIGFTGGGHCTATSPDRLRAAGAHAVAATAAELADLLSN